MVRPTCWQQKKVPFRWVSIRASQSCSLTSSAGLVKPKPALLTSTRWRSREVASVRATSPRARTSASRVTSVRSTSALPPSASITALRSARRASVRPARSRCAPAAANASAIARPIPMPAPVTMAIRPSSRNDGRLSAIASAGPPGGGVEGMDVDHQPLVERVGSVDVDPVLGYDVVVLEPDAADPGLAGVGLEVEYHALLEHDRCILRGRAEVRRLPRVDPGAVAQAVEHVGIGLGEHLGVGRARADHGGGVEQRVIAFLVQLALLGGRLDVAAHPGPGQVAPIAVEAGADVEDDEI